MWNFFSCLSDSSLKNLINVAIPVMEDDARKQGASEADIIISRAIGFHPSDVRVFRQFTTEYKYLFVIRCPKPDARAFIGILPPKPATVKEKSNSVGIVGKSDHRHFGDVNIKWYVSDYDLMCVYKISSSGEALEKVFFSGTDPKNPKSPLSLEAGKIIRNLNSRLKNKLQHGAQDDYSSKSNRGVKMNDDRHVAALLGELRPLGDGHSTRVFYDQFKLKWPYDDVGFYKL